MRLLLTRSENIVLTIIITHLTLSLLYRLSAVSLGGSIVNLSEFYSYRLIGKLTVFFSGSGVQSTQSNMGTFFHFHRTSFSSMIKSRVSSILTKGSVLRINLNLDGTPITSKSHTHPSLDVKTGLLTGLLAGKQDWKCPVALIMTCYGSKSLKVILIDSDFRACPVLHPLVTI